MMDGDEWMGRRKGEEGGKGKGSPPLYICMYKLMVRVCTYGVL